MNTLTLNNIRKILQFFMLGDIIFGFWIKGENLNYIRILGGVFGLFFILQFNLLELNKSPQKI